MFFATDSNLLSRKAIMLFSAAWIYYLYINGPTSLWPSHDPNVTISNTFTVMRPGLHCKFTRSVRRDSLLALHVLLQIRGTWIDKIAPLFARVLYQRIFLEPEESFYSLLIKVTSSIICSLYELRQLLCQPSGKCCCFKFPANSTVRGH